MTRRPDHGAPVRRQERERDVRGFGREAGRGPRDRNRQKRAIQKCQRGGRVEGGPRGIPVRNADRGRKNGRIVAPGQGLAFRDGDTGMRKENEGRATGFDPVSVREDARLDRDAIDEGSVQAAEILDREFSAFGSPKDAMAPRRAAVGYGDIRPRVASDDGFVCFQGKGGAFQRP